jgi:phospholipid/cholesterol/gamma-HCH transport system substrate-binding protein
MEQDGYYFRVGLFVALAMVAAIFVIGWFSSHRDELGKTTYAIYMKGSVSGLTLGAPVTLSGIQVGNVKDISFAASTDTALIRVIVDIVDTAPVHSDTVASLKFQGITGTSYVGLDNTGQQPQPLTATDQDGMLTIPSVASPLDRVVTSVPELIDQITKLSERGQALLDDKNIGAVHDLLVSLNKVVGASNGQSLESAVSELNGLIIEGKDTMREVKMLTRTLREDPSIVVYGTKHPGVKVP